MTDGLRDCSVVCRVSKRYIERMLDVFLFMSPRLNVYDDFIILFGAD